MQRLGVGRARPDGGGVVYDDVRSTGLQPLVDGWIEVGRRRNLGLDQCRVEIVVERCNRTISADCVASGSATG